MASPRIVADKNIPYVGEAFAHLGEVVTMPSSAIDAAAVRDADLLLVRSTVKVGEELLGASRVRFVATATIGTDHLDLSWLAARGVRVASAPGSNAPSVALWWAAALLELAVKRRERLAGRTVGIVGVGNVGRRIDAVARALGMVVLRCDPPRARAEGPDQGEADQEGFLPLGEVLRRSQVLTLHVPLCDDPPVPSDRTRTMIGAAQIARLPAGAWLVNSCRGPVLDGAAASEARRTAHLGALVCDVFEPEPAVSPEHVTACDLATAHIAGHSLDGKAAGTAMVYEAACAFLGERPRWIARRALLHQPAAAIALDARALDDEGTAHALMRRFYRIDEDHAALRRIAATTDEIARAAAFRAFRDTYPPHREPAGVSVDTIPPRRRALALLEALGAQIRRDP